MKRNIKSGASKRTKKNALLTPTMVTGGIIHSYDLSKTSVYNIKELKNNKPFYHNCSILEDKGYISAENQLDIFDTVNIRLECPYRLIQKN